MGKTLLGLSEAQISRFHSNVDRRSNGDCWPWNGSVGDKGRAQFWANGKSHKASRIAWALYHKKPFPDELCACHSCDNPNCVNPHHIWPGTHRENMMDAISKGIIRPGPGYARKTHCKRGHPFNEENTRIRDGKYRVCRACARILNDKYAGRDAHV